MHNVLDEIVGNRTQVRLLRAFFSYPEKEFHERELERLMKIPQASVHRNVKRLIENGLLDMKRIGRANLYSLNRAHILHPLLKKVFEEEKNILVALRNLIAHDVRALPEADLAVLFGSIAKGTERPDSDVDIFILCRGDKSRLEGKLAGLALAVRDGFGNTISPMIKTAEELKELKIKPIYKEIKAGEIIFKREGVTW